MVDYQMMSRNVRGFMSLFHCGQAGRLQGARLLRRRRHRHGAVLATCSSSPTTPRSAIRRRASGARRPPRCGRTASASSRPSGCSSPATACPAPRRVEWGLAIEARRAELDERFETLLARIARDADQPARHDEAAASTRRCSRRACTRRRSLGTVLRRHRAPHAGGLRLPAARRCRPASSEAVRERDEPFGDPGSSTFKG